VAQTKPKEISEAERRERAETRAANKAAREQREREELEANERQIAKNAYDNIWRDFNKDLLAKGKNFANKNLLANLTEFGSELVPLMMTETAHTKLILDLTDKIAAEDTGGNDTPLELVEKWLAGDIELSRIPLEPVEVVSTGNLDAFSETEE
jgi:hypothetical protein